MGTMILGTQLERYSILQKEKSRRFCRTSLTETAIRFVRSRAVRKEIFGVTALTHMVKAGHEIRSDSFTANGVPYVYQTREYRDNGYLSQCCDYKVDGTVDWCGVYRYDEKNYLGSDEYNSVSNLTRFAIKEG